VRERDEFDAAQLFGEVAEFVNALFVDLDEAQLGAVFAASNCHGTRFEWCSSCEVRIASPALRFWRPQLYETRLIASVVLRVPDDLADSAPTKRATFSRAPSKASVARWCEFVDASMDVRVVVRVVMDERVDHRPRLL